MFCSTVICGQKICSRGNLCVLHEGFFWSDACCSCGNLCLCNLCHVLRWKTFMWEMFWCLKLFLHSCLIMLLLLAVVRGQEVGSDNCTASENVTGRLQIQRR